MKKIFTVLRSVPTTKVRILVSIALTVWLSFAVIERGFTPPIEYLGFILINSGIDLSAYALNARKKLNNPTIENPHEIENENPMFEKG